MFIYLGYYLALGSKLRLSTALHRIVASMVCLSNGALTTGSTQSHQWQYCCTSIAAGDRVNPNMEACTLSPSLLPPQRQNAVQFLYFRALKLQYAYEHSGDLAKFKFRLTKSGVGPNGLHY